MDINVSALGLCPLHPCAKSALKITSKKSHDFYEGVGTEITRNDTDEVLHVKNTSLSEDRMLSLPEVTYGLRPRMTWLFRLMERSGAGGARHACSLPWYENDNEAFEHHAKYLKRLSKLREELIHQEQNNLANALDRLKLRSYGPEFVYGQHERERKTRQKNSSQTEAGSKHNSLLTTFEKFQKMRPKKFPPQIMPIEGKSLIDASAVTSDMLGKLEHRQTGNGNGINSAQSINESIRTNLQRLTAYPISSIPRQRRHYNRDLVLESSSLHRHEHHKPMTSNNEDKTVIMQKQKQKLKKLRDEIREAETKRFMPQIFKLDTKSDEDHTNSVPKIHVNISIKHSVDSNTESAIANVSRYSRNGKHAGYRVTTDFPIPPCIFNCSCKMYVNGNKVDPSLGQAESSTNSANNSYGIFSNVLHKNGIGNSRGSSSSTEKSWQLQKSTSKLNSQINPHEKKQIRIDMPTIIYNNSQGPDPMESDYNAGLAKLFKQKELRQKELFNLIEDVKELNKRTETLFSSIS